MFSSVQRVLFCVVFGSALPGHAWAKTLPPPQVEDAQSLGPPFEEDPEEEAEKVEVVASVDALHGSMPCATNLTRPASEVLVEIGKDFAFSSPLRYVEVRAGESICVELATEEAGGVSIRAVAEGPDSQGHLRIVLTKLEEAHADGTVSILSMTNHLNEPIALHVARPQGDGGVVLFEREIFRVPARSELVRRFDYPISRALVGSIPQAPRPMAAEPRPPFQEDSQRPPPSISSPWPPSDFPHETPERVHGLPETGVRRALDVYLIGGSIFNHSSDLEDVVTANDFGQLPHHQELMGFGFGLTLRRVRFAWDLLVSFPREIESLDSGPDAKQNQVLISLEGGYDVFRYRGFSIFPLVGFTAGDLSVRTHPDGPALLPAQISGYYNNETDVRRNVYSVRGTLGVQNISLISPGERAGLVYGLRVGYQHQFAQSKWLTDTDDPNAPPLSGGPKVQTSGIYVQLLFGISLLSW